MQKKIVIVTSGQPSANPRVVKEAMALNNAGYNVTVIYAPLSPWADGFDKELFATTPTISWICAGANSQTHPYKYKYVRLRRKAYELLEKKMPFLFNAKENAFVLYAQELKRKASKLKADLYIGHNLGALPAVVAASKKWNAAAGFDAEDHHTGESQPGSLQYKLAYAIENRFIPQLQYFSGASPMIVDAYQHRFSSQNIFTLNNVFSKKYLQPVHHSEKKGLSLFWFSQTVGTNRGLELVVDALNKLVGFDITLHILGTCSDSYKKELSDRSTNPDNIYFLPPTSLDNVFKIASQFDIGLASEVPYCENRKLCLTNKIFTYLLASNCLLASDTPAQQQFFENYPGNGLLYKHNDAEDLANQLGKLYDDRSLLLQYKQNAHSVSASVLNWESESEILLEKVATILN